MRRVIFIAVLVASLIIINNLIRSIYSLWNKQDLIVKAKNDLTREKDENHELKSQLSIVGSKQFVEEEARNKLFFVKPGEQDVIVPQNLLNKTSGEKPDNTPNWKKWWNLFF